MSKTLQEIEQKDYREIVTQQMANSLLKSSPRILSLSLFYGIFIAWLIHTPENSLDLTLWVIFRGVILLGIIGYIVYMQRINNEDALNWRLGLISGFLLGIPWGCLAWLIFPELPSIKATMLVLFVAIINAMYIFMASMLVEGYILFMLSSMTPYVLVSFSTTHNNLEWLSISYVLLMLTCIVISKKANMLIKQNVEAGLKNEAIKKALLEEKKRVEEINDYKTRFIAAASHDLRQPLQSQQIYVEQAFSFASNEKEKKILEKLKLNINSLGSLLNGLLDVSKLDANMVHSNPTHFALNELFITLRNDFQPLAKEKNLELIVVDTDFTIYSDPLLLEVVLRNLLSNAIKYTNTGMIILTASLSNSEVLLEVSDTGSGIPKDKQQYIFKAFTQLDTNPNDNSKGFGLGLNIVKRICAILGAKITITKSDNSGTTFQVNTGPVSRTLEEKEVISIQFDILKNKRVLFLEDDEQIREGLTTELQEWGCEVKPCKTISETIKSIKKEDPFDLVLSDFSLPDGDARQLINHINENHTKCIILTGNTMHQNLLQLEDAGYLLLHKPISPNKLRTMMASRLGQHIN